MPTWPRALEDPDHRKGVLDTRFRSRTHLKNFKGHTYGSRVECANIKKFLLIGPRSNNSCQTFLPLLLSSDRSIEPEFFLATFVIPASKERKLKRSSLRRMLDVFKLPLLRGWSHHRNVPYGNFNQIFRLKSYPEGSRALTQHENSAQPYTYHFLLCSG